jgi:RNA polymerase sigma-70 factor (ECF subfamily)
MSVATTETAAHDESAGDAALARRVRAGDADAEAELCRRMLPRARAWGFKYLRDEAAALDLAQDVCMTLLEALRADRVVELDRIGAFVLGICKRTLLGRRSGEGRRAELLARFGTGFDGTAEIDDRVIDRRRLAGCFERLAPRARTVLALSFYAECEPDEVARQLATTIGNVRVIRHRALEQLHACMEGTP